MKISLSNILSPGTNELTRNVFILTSGITIAQAIPILLQPFLRRLFTPAEFGAFAIFLSIIEIIVSIGTLHYEMAIVLPRKDVLAANLLGLSFIISFAINTIAFLGILIFHNILARAVNFPPQFVYWLYFIPLVTLLFCISQSVNYWLIRKKAFWPSSINKISRRAMEGSVQLFFGIGHLNLGLVIGTVFGHIANIISGIYQLRATDFQIGRITKEKLRYVYRRYIEFPKYSTIPSLLNVVSLLLPLFIINKIFSEKETGYFDLTRQILLVPVALISYSLSQVLFQQITEKKHSSKSISKDIHRITFLLFLFSFIGVLLLWLWGTDLFVILFGKQWRMSGEIAKVVVIGFAFRFIVATLSIILVGLEKIKWYSLWQTFYFIAILSLAFVPEVTFYQFCIFYTIIESVSYIAQYLLILIVLRQYETHIRIRSDYLKT
jgi:O-antigen/teichoic acid export membrane protein